MTREQVIEAIEAAYGNLWTDRCGSEAEQKDVKEELKEVLTWIADRPQGQKEAR